MVNWKKPDSSIELESGSVHLWRADLNLSQPNLQLARELLSKEELERADRMISESLQHRRIAAQSILRDILSRYLTISAHELEFSFGERKKPFIPGSEIEFNMTHSDYIALYAISRKRPIGVDVEVIKTSKYQDNLVKSNFSPEENAQYQSLPESEKLHAFFRGWTRKEAYIKAIGLGLYYPLEKFTVDLSSENQQGLLSIEGSSEKAQNWYLPSFLLDEKFFAAVAVEGPVNNWLFLEWEEFCKKLE